LVLNPNGFVRDGSASGHSSEPSKGSVEFFILFLRLWTHLDAFRNLQNLFGGFCKLPLFFSEYNNIDDQRRCVSHIYEKAVFFQQFGPVVLLSNMIRSALEKDHADSTRNKGDLPCTIIYQEGSKCLFCCIW
jgi:hypothetical protein